MLSCAETLKKPLLILHAPLDETVGIENASKIFIAAKHPKSFVSLDDTNHLLSNAADARYAANVIAAWAARYVGGVEAPKKVSAAGEAAPFKGGATAQSIKGKALAVALSIDGHPYVIDAGPEDGGDGLGPNPTRVVEGALAACSAMTMKLYANRKGWDLQGSKVTVKRGEGQDSHVSRVLEKEIELDGDLDDKQRARLKEIAGKCPVHRMLSEEVEIRSAGG